MEDVEKIFGEDYAIAKEVKKTWMEAGFAEPQEEMKKFIDDSGRYWEMDVLACKKRFECEGSWDIVENGSFYVI
jgi:hypothetical protein